MKTTVILVLLGLSVLVGCSDDNGAPANKGAAEQATPAPEKKEVKEVSLVEQMPEKKEEIIAWIKGMKEISNEDYESIADKVEFSELATKDINEVMSALDTHIRNTRYFKVYESRFKSSLVQHTLLKGKTNVRDFDPEIKNAIEELEALSKQHSVTGRYHIIDEELNTEYFTLLAHIQDTRNDNDPQVEYLTSYTNLLKKQEKYNQLVDYFSEIK